MREVTGSRDHTSQNGEALFVDSTCSSPYLALVSSFCTPVVLFSEPLQYSCQCSCGTVSSARFSTRLRNLILENYTLVLQSSSCGDIDIKLFRGKN